MFYSLISNFKISFESNNGFFYPSQKILVCSVITLFFIKNKLCMTIKPIQTLFPVK